MPRASSTSAGAIYLDRARRLEEVRAAARRAASRLPSIRRMLLFGSLQAGDATPRSDADILVVLDRSDRTNPRDRIPDILRAMAPLPCPVDLFVLTSDEVDRTEREQNPVVRLALDSGIDLLAQGLNRLHRHDPVEPPLRDV